MNRFKTTLLLGGLTALVPAAGYYFGGQQGAIALLILTPIITTLLHLAVSRSREMQARVPAGGTRRRFFQVQTLRLG